MNTLPPNATPLLRAVDAATARITRIPVPLADLWTAARCPLSHLPWLAWALGVGDWDSDWPEETKRTAIRLARRKHELRGTWAAIRAEMELLGAVWDYAEGPEPMTGTVTIHNGSSLRTAGLAGLRPRLDGVKRAAFHLAITLRTGIRAELRVSGAATALSIRRADIR